MLLVKDITFGLSKFAFISIQTLLFDSWYQAFLYLPALAIISKLIPEGVESSIVGVFKGLQAFSVGVYGRIIGVALGHVMGTVDQIGG
jgi:hypothetical protein